MTGSLSEQHIAEPLKTIHQNSLSGTLEVQAHQAAAKKLIFSEGSCVDVGSSDPVDDFGELLVRMGKISPDQLDLVASSASSPGALASALVEMKLFGPEEMADFQTLHAQELIFGLFGLAAGTFEFKEEAPHALDSGIRLGLPALIFEGIRRMTNTEMIHRGLKGSDRAIRWTADFEQKAIEISLKPDEAFILSRIESSALISEVLQLSPLGLEMTQKTLYGLIATGVVEFVPQAGEPAPQQPPAASRAYRSAGAPSAPQAVTNAEDTPPHVHTAAPTPPPAPAPSPSPVEELEKARAEILLMQDKAMTKNYYELLGVTVSSGPDEIKKAYYSLAKKFHPDRYHQSTADDLKAALETIFSTLSQAYETLKVPATRASYDAKHLRTEQPSVAAENLAPSAPANGSGSAPPQQKLADLNYRQGRGYYDQQDFWSAIQAFRQSVRMDPENARYRYWLAMSLSKSPKSRREAEEHFQKAIELDQFVAEYYMGLGLLYKEAGLPKRSENQFRKALEVSPNNQSARAALDALLGTSTNTKKKGPAFAGLKSLFKRK